MQYLISQYNLLSNEEKNVIIIYKTRLGAIINSLDKINSNEYPPYFINAYNEYKLTLNNVNNMFLKFSTFYAIDDLNIDTFYNSLLNVKKTLLSCQNKIILPDDITLYRGISTNDLENLELLSKDKLVSTSTNQQVCKSFLNINKYNILDIIKVKANTSVIVASYSIKRTYNDIADAINGNVKASSLKIQYNDDQSEIILFKNTLNII